MSTESDTGCTQSAVARNDFGEKEAVEKTVFLGWNADVFDLEATVVDKIIATVKMANFFIIIIFLYYWIIK